MNHAVSRFPRVFTLCLSLLGACLGVVQADQADQCGPEGLIARWTFNDGDLQSDVYDTDGDGTSDAAIELVDHAADAYTEDLEFSRDGKTGYVKVPAGRTLWNVFDRESNPALESLEDEHTIYIRLRHAKVPCRPIGLFDSTQRGNTGWGHMIHVAHVYQFADGDGETKEVRVYYRTDVKHRSYVAKKAWNLKPDAFYEIVLTAKKTETEGKSIDASSMIGGEYVDHVASGLDDAWGDHIHALAVGTLSDAESESPTIEIDEVRIYNRKLSEDEIENIEPVPAP